MISLLLPASAGVFDRVFYPTHTRKGGLSVKKFIAMLTVAAVVFASLGCGGEPAKTKDKDKDKAPATKDKEKEKDKA
jgi:hypothetical protein